VTVAAVLAPLSVVAAWANSQIRDTDRYLATMAPLASDPAVQDAVAARLQEVVLANLDLGAEIDEAVGALEEQGLPPRAAAALGTLTTPLVSGVEDFVRERIDTLVRSESFEQAWVEANRVAHEQLVAALTGESDGAVQVTDGAVTVELATLVNAVKEQLVAAGLEIAERIPDVTASFVIVQSDSLAQVQDLLRVLDRVATVLPVLVLVLLAVAVVVARDRWRWVLVSGLAVALAMVLLGVGLVVVRSVYLDALPPGSSEAAAAAVYDQLVSFLRRVSRVVAVLGLLVALVAWLAAPRGSGAALRRRVAAGAGGLRHRVQPA
jgi:hypothetical protein